MAGYNMKLENFLYLEAYRPTNKITCRWCHCLAECQKFLYCPFFPLHGSHRSCSIGVVISKSSGSAY